MKPNYTAALFRNKHYNLSIKHGKLVIFDRSPQPGSSTAQWDRNPQPGLSSAPPSGSSERRIHLYAGEFRGQWCLHRVFNELGTQDQCVEFSEQRGLVLTSKNCPRHRNPMHINRSAAFGELGAFRCHKSRCRGKVGSHTKGTWFENAFIAYIDVSIKVQRRLFLRSSAKGDLIPKGN
ncbi:uncharacterized protein LOC113229139 [Hyposmocoma kahamanoa]|uniref:uncharacterized protein LOC113229139 n=1 Tax=Hyposmocoma kahamanoa TaxID=1477025 RepID=UPI000E6D7822|nr:uncharacterized protein LOC113229139 [Hyposmocoma kahamanoa]